jgi:hypothetical protein
VFAAPALGMLAAAVASARRRSAGFAVHSALSAVAVRRRKVGNAARHGGRKAW